MIVACEEVSQLHKFPIFTDACVDDRSLSSSDFRAKLLELQTYCVKNHMFLKTDNNANNRLFAIFMVGYANPNSNMAFHL